MRPARVAAEQLLVCVLSARAAAGTATGAELNTLAMAYDSGRGCTPNYFLAFVFLEAAASLGHEIAAATLAEETDNPRWWRRAAELGNECAASRVQVLAKTSQSLYSIHRGTNET